MTTITNPHTGPALLITDADNSKSLWIDATEDEQTNLEYIAESGIAVDSFVVRGHEEFEGFDVDLTNSLTTLLEQAQFIGKHGKLGALMLSSVHGHVESSEQAINNSLGQYLSKAEFAKEHVKEGWDLPYHISSCIDFDKLFTKLEVELAIFAIEVGPNEVHIFNNY